MPNRGDMGGLFDASSRNTIGQHLTFRQVGAHGTLCLFKLWAEYLRRHKELNKKHLFIGVFMAPLLMGALIELAQATCTGGNRSGDWLDFAANSIGVVVGNVIGMLLAKCFAKDKKGK